MKKLLLVVAMLLCCSFVCAEGDNVFSRYYSAERHAGLFPKIPETTKEVYSYNTLKAALAELSKIKIEVWKRQNPDGTLVNYTYKIVRKKDGENDKTFTVGTDYNAEWNLGKKEVLAKTVDYSAFANSGDRTKDLYELAGWLANISQETKGGNPGDTDDGLYHAREVTTIDDKRYDKNESGDPQLDPVPGAHYYGRGCKQLSYSNNYGIFSFCYYGDHTILLKHPEKVEALDFSVNPIGSPDQDKRLKEYLPLAFASGLHFWMFPAGEKPSCHDVINTYRGFAKTINVINGGVECFKDKNGYHPASVGRARYFKAYLQKLDVSITDPDVTLRYEYLVPWNMRPNDFSDKKDTEQAPFGRPDPFHPLGDA